MALFNRKPVHLGDQYAGSPSGTLEGLLTGNPFSTHFLSPGGKTASDMVRYMERLQQRRYGEIIQPTHPALTQGALKGRAKRLIKKYGAGMVERGITQAAWLSEYPFSFTFVETCIEEWLNG